MVQKNAKERHKEPFCGNENYTTIEEKLAISSTKSFTKQNIKSWEYKIPSQPNKPGGYSSIGVFVDCEQLQCPLVHEITKWLICLLLMVSSKRVATFWSNPHDPSNVLTGCLACKPFLHCLCTREEEGKFFAKCNLLLISRTDTFFEHTSLFQPSLQPIVYPDRISGPWTLFCTVCA